MNDPAKKLLFDVLEAGYDTVDDAAVWGIVEAHLPALVAQVDELLPGNDKDI